MTTGPPHVDDAEVDEVVAFILKGAKGAVGTTKEQADIVSSLAAGYATLKWPDMTKAWVDALALRVRQRVMWSKPTDHSA